MLDGDLPISLGLAKQRGTLRDGNRASDVISRLRALYRIRNSPWSRSDLMRPHEEVDCIVPERSSRGNRVYFEIGIR